MVLCRMIRAPCDDVICLYRERNTLMVEDHQVVGRAPPRMLCMYLYDESTEPQQMYQRKEMDCALMMTEMNMIV